MHLLAERVLTRRFSDGAPAGLLGEGHHRFLFFRKHPFFTEFTQMLAACVQPEKCSFQGGLLYKH